MGHRLWLPTVAIHRLVVVEIAPSPHHCFRTAHPCAQSVKGLPTEPVLSRSSRQRLGHLQSHFDGGWHICQAVFPEPQSAAACRRVERRDCVHEAFPRLQSISSVHVASTSRALPDYKSAILLPPSHKSKIFPAIPYYLQNLCGALSYRSISFCSNKKEISSLQYSGTAVYKNLQVFS